MNRPIRRVGYVVTVLILLLVGQLTYLQVVDANKLANDPRNVRGALKEYNRARGEILTADGTVVAQSLPTTGDFKYVRFYPQGGLYAHTAGYQSFVNLVGTTGVEASYNKVLTGQDTSLQLNDIGGLLRGKSQTNNVVLSLTQTRTDHRRAGAREPARFGGGARREDRRRARDVLEPDVQPQRPVGARHAGGADHVQPDQRRRQARPAARLPRPLPAGFHVQGRHRQVGHRDRDRDSRHTGVPRPGRLRDPRHDHHAQELRRRDLWRHVAPEPHRLVQRHLRRARLPDGRRVRARDGAVRHRQRAPDRPVTGRGRQRGTAGGRTPPPLRPRRHRPGRRADRTPPDGAHRRRHRQRRDHRATPRGEGDPELRRQDRAHRRRRRNGRPACRRRPRRRSTP